MLKRRVKSLLGLAILSVSMASALSSCTSGNTSNQTEEKVIQTLNGSGSINDTNYDFELRILEADNMKIFGVNGHSLKGKDIS